MTAKLNQAALSGVKKLLLVQVGLTLGMALICGVSNGWLAFFSASLAGICCLFSTAAFAAIMFRKAGARAAMQIARSFYRAEVIKWLMMVSLMMMVFIFVPVVAGAFFATLCVVQMAYWAAPGLFNY